MIIETTINLKNKSKEELILLLNESLGVIKKLQKENEELKEDRDKFKKALGKRITYCNELEKDLFENCSNYVIPKQIVKDKIEEILNNGEYRIIFEGDAEFPDEATCIDAQKYIKLEKLQELLEGRK